VTTDEAKALTHCDHTERKAVRFVDSSGRIGVRLQCQRCGSSGGNVKANGYNVDRLPTFNQALVDRWETYRRQVWEKQNDDRAAAYQAKQEQERQQFFAEYAIYLQSPHWESVRRRTIARDQFTCQLCQRRVEVNTAHVHHLSYATYNQVGQSLPAECVTLCRSCHERIETAKQAA